MFKMNVKRPSTFKSYVCNDDSEPKTLETSLDDTPDQLNPRLLRGEAVIAEAQNVLMYAPTSERHGKSGILIVTNFKLSFVTTEELQREERRIQENLILGEYDICLSNVDEVHQMVGEKKKKLSPGSSVSGKVKGLYIVCKNMKVFQFNFKFSPVGHGRTLVNALLHHAFPLKHHLLFAYDYGGEICNCKKSVSMFRESVDWEDELIRTRAEGWRLSFVNKNFTLSTSMPEWLIVPSAVVDCQLVEAARHFRCSRPPVWCWSGPQGAALVRMADLQPAITDSRMLVIQPSVIRHSGLSNVFPEARMQENVMLENVRKSHPKLEQPMLIELTQNLPTPKDINISYTKLRDLCTPENVRQFWIQDNHFLSQVENSRWLHTVSSCLGKAVEAATHLSDNVTVVLQEADGRDLSCVVATLTQLLMDSHYRTIVGFQSLLQKEWVALGHPFSSRLGHVINSDIQQSPLLLLLLDCVWQILCQCPVAFEFCETYLTTLWDAAHTSIFDTFLFDCERDRVLAHSDPSRPLKLRSVWNWSEQFLDKDVALFYNPLYSCVERNTTIKVQHGIPHLSLWSQCYFRWIPLLEIQGGGSVQTDLSMRSLRSEIDSLRNKLSQADTGEEVKDSNFPVSTHNSLTSFFPFGAGSERTAKSVPPNNSLTLNNSFLSNEGLLDSQLLLND